MAPSNLSSNSLVGEVLIQIRLPKNTAETLGSYTKRKGETVEERIVSLVIRHVQHLKASDEIERWLERGYEPITEVIPLENFSLHVKFDDGFEDDFDMEPTIGRGGVFSKLAQFELFKQVKISQNGEALVWPENIAVDAKTIYWTLYQQGSKGF